MKKLRKLALTIAALSALAVGGAAIAQAQNTATVAKVTMHQPRAESSPAGDTDNVQSGSQSGPDQGGNDGEQTAAEESGTDAPDSVSESDAPDGHQDQSGTSDTGHDGETSD
ncbi:MAG: hypothetical protein H0X42_08915 [Solirubrobacterales bacterium]|nr:hypothetical protein [Solirubrobacterales bacterium]